MLGRKMVWGVLALATTSVFAHPGPTDRWGCHHCWEDCEKWGLRYGEYHCHQPPAGEDQDHLTNPHEHYHAPKHPRHEHDYVTEPRHPERHGYYQWRRATPQAQQHRPPQKRR